MGAIGLRLPDFWHGRNPRRDAVVVLGVAFGELRTVAVMVAQHWVVGGRGSRGVTKA